MNTPTIIIGIAVIVMLLVYAVCLGVDMRVKLIHKERRFQVNTLDTTRQGLDVAIRTELGVGIKAQPTSASGVPPVHMYMQVGGAWISAFVSIEDARTLGQGLVALADALGVLI